jgi:hypothetical protein
MEIKPLIMRPLVLPEIKLAPLPKYIFPDLSNTSVMVSAPAATVATMTAITKPSSQAVIKQLFDLSFIEEKLDEKILATPVVNVPEKEVEPLYPVLDDRQEPLVLNEVSAGSQLLVASANFSVNCDRVIVAPGGPRIAPIEIMPVEEVTATLFKKPKKKSEEPVVKRKAAAALIC